MAIPSFADDNWIDQFDRGERRNKPNFLNFLFGQGERTQQFSQLTPQQQGLQQQQIQGVSQQMPQMLQYLQQILSGDQGLMDQFQAPSRRAFREQTIPTIMERFTGMGAQESSGFQQALAGAGERLEEGLGAQQAQLKGDTVTQLMQLLQGAQRPSFDTLHTKATPGVLQTGVESILPILALLKGG